MTGFNNEYLRNIVENVGGSVSGHKSDNYLLRIIAENTSDFTGTGGGGASSMEEFNSLKEDVLTKVNFFEVDINTLVEYDSNIDYTNPFSVIDVLNRYIVEKYHGELEYNEQYLVSVKIESDFLKDLYLINLPSPHHSTVLIHSSFLLLKLQEAYKMANMSFSVDDDLNLLITRSV